MSKTSSSCDRWDNADSTTVSLPNACNRDARKIRIFLLLQYSNHEQYLSDFRRRGSRIRSDGPHDPIMNKHTRRGRGGQAASTCQ